MKEMILINSFDLEILFGVLKITDSGNRKTYHTSHLIRSTLTQLLSGRVNATLDSVFPGNLILDATPAFLYIKVYQIEWKFIPSKWKSFFSDEKINMVIVKLQIIQRSLKTTYLRNGRVSGGETTLCKYWVKAGVNGPGEEEEEVSNKENPGE